MSMDVKLYLIETRISWNGWMVNLWRKASWNGGFHAWIWNMRDESWNADDVWMFWPWLIVLEWAKNFDISRNEGCWISQHHPDVWLRGRLWFNSGWGFSKAPKAPRHGRSDPSWTRCSETPGRNHGETFCDVCSVQRFADVIQTKAVATLMSVHLCPGLQNCYVFLGKDGKRWGKCSVSWAFLSVFMTLWSFWAPFLTNKLPGRAFLPQ